MLKPLTLILALLATPGAAQSAKWEIITDSDPSRCDFRFSGVIERGDLTGFVDTLRSTPRSTPNISICLDSEGGSMLEVLSFIELMDQEKVFFMTTIERNAVCTSSCALLFMFGTGYGTNQPFRSRYLEPGGRLGFHSFSAVPHGIELAPINEVFSVAMQAARLIADRSYKALTMDGPAVPQELLSFFFGTMSEDLHYVDMVGELELLDISIDRSFKIRTLPNDERAFHDTVKRICASSYVLSYRSFFTKEGYHFADLVEEVRRRISRGIHMHKLAHVRGDADGRGTVTAMASGPYWVPLWLSGGASLFCQVRFSVQEVPEGFLINNYWVGFGRGLDMTEDFADWDDLRLWGLTVGLVPLSVGLIPIDQRYE